MHPADRALLNAADRHFPLEPELPACACGCGEDADPATGYAPGCGEEEPEDHTCSCGLALAGFVELELVCIPLAVVPAAVEPLEDVLAGDPDFDRFVDEQRAAWMARLDQETTSLAARAV